jgi:hypothetical protein
LETPDIPCYDPFSTKKGEAMEREIVFNFSSLLVALQSASALVTTAYFVSVKPARWIVGKVLGM